MLSDKVCGIKNCIKQVEFFCGNCEMAFYCSEDHQKQHWKSEHRKQCGATGDVKLNQLKSYYGNRNRKRKDYFECFLNQKTEDALLLVRELLLFQDRIKNINKELKRQNTDDQFQHASTVCLFIRTLITMNDRLTARSTLQNFMATNTIINDTKRLPIKGKVTQQSNKFMSNKLNLISTLANLQHNLQISPVDLYVLYTQNIQLVFGKDSLEASNCFFMMGHYYFDDKQYVKAIVCFKRTAQMRNDINAYQCYVNIGVCYRNLRRNIKAKDMFEKALNILIQTNKQYSNEAAKLHEYLSITNIQQMNIIQGIKHIQSAYLIRNKDIDNANCKQLNKLIRFIYDYTDKYIQDGIVELQKSELFRFFKDNNIQPKDNMDQNMIIKNEQKKKISNKVAENLEKAKDSENMQEMGKNILNALVAGALKEDEAPQVKGGYGNHKLKIPKGLIDSLEPEQISHLAKLQLDLEKCVSDYRVMNVYKKSQFISSLNQAQRKQFKKENFSTLRDLDIVNPRQQDFLQQTDDKKKKIGKKLTTTNSQRNG